MKANPFRDSREQRYSYIDVSNIKIIHFQSFISRDRNSQGVETCNSHMFALSDDCEYSFSRVPYLEREERITVQSNLITDMT